MIRVSREPHQSTYGSDEIQFHCNEILSAARNTNTPGASSKCGEMGDCVVWIDCICEGYAASLNENVWE